MSRVIGIDLQTSARNKAPTIRSGIQNVTAVINRAFKFFFADANGDGIPLSIWSGSSDLSAEFDASEYTGCVAVDENGILRYSENNMWTDMEGAHNHDGVYAPVNHEHDTSDILDPENLTVDLNCLSWNGSYRYIQTEHPGDVPPITIGTFAIVLQRFE